MVQYSKALEKSQTTYNIYFVNVLAWGMPCCHSTLFLCQGFLGISGAIMIQAYGIFRNGKPSTFILMLALLPTFVSIVLVFFVRIHEANTIDDTKHLNGFRCCFDHCYLSHNYTNFGEHFKFALMGTHYYVYTSFASTCITNWNCDQSTDGGLQEICANIFHWE